MLRTAQTSLQTPCALLALGLVAFSAACVDQTPAEPSGPCVPTETYFEEQVWNNFMSNTCFACHNAQGAAAGSQLVLQNSNQPGYLKNNLGRVENVATLERDGTSYILLKPSGQLDHGGGTVIEQNGPEWMALQGLVDRFKEPVECEVVETGDFFQNVELLDNEQTVRKAGLALVGRLPTDEEFAQVSAGDDADVDAVLDNMMQEAAFLDRMKEIYNDLFLTNRYLGGDNATNLLDQDDYPNNRWYDDLDPEVVSQDYIDAAQQYTNNSVARAPLELVAHLIENDRPFTEILTADYMMVNSYSAQVYGIEDVTFNDPTDPGEFVEGRIPGIPHAGILTDPMWLNRFPTTATNRNRHRSRMVWQFFMATDIMKLADRPVDPTSIVEHNPTMFNPQCNVCHANIDPIAGTFQNWDGEGRYRPPEEGWYAEMRRPGMSEEDILPSGDYTSSLQWLGRQIADNELFALATVYTAYTALTGQEPLSPPSLELPDAEFDARDAAFKAQDKDFQAIAKTFIDDGHNFKSIVRALVKSKWFRAESATREQLKLADVGTARFLTPEMLDRKIEAVTGQRWVRGYDQRSYLRSENEYLIFYGGIDSDDVTQRITEPNGLMASIAVRMANEMSCRVVPREFTKAAADRKLFPAVEMTYEPADANGFEIAGAVQAIKENIVHLHWHILGERLTVDDPEVERTYQLFLQTWQEGVEKRANDEVSRDLDYGCRATTDEYGDDLPEEQQVWRDDRYTVRAWMAVMSYLLSDWRFLHE